MAITGIYARQSLDKKDSLSIETQIEKCVSLCNYKGKEHKVYMDKGFSGKNVQRPYFEKLMHDIKNGLIDEVVVYRVDRISRNLNDFTSMVAEFDKSNVTFASATESFDTGTPMGRAMMYLLLIFAQLERETIAERIKDNAMYRATLGRWTGGVVPYGYEKSRVQDGTKTKSLLVINEKEADIVRQFFSWYLEPKGSVRGVVYKANMLGLKTREGAEWGNSTVSRVLQNVIYSTNTNEIYTYFSENDLGLTVLNQPEEFDGQHAMMYYRKRGEDVKRRKGQKTQEQFVIVGEHEGIIPGDMWAKAQEKIHANKSLPPRAMTGGLTYLSGLVKCGVCGSPMVVSWSGVSNKRLYMRCRRKEMNGKFLCANKSIRIDELEKVVADKIFEICNNQGFIEALINEAAEIEKNSLIPLKDQKKVLQERIQEKEQEIGNLIASLRKTNSELVLRQVEKEVLASNIEVEKFKNELRIINEKIQYTSGQTINKQYLIENYKTFSAAFEKADLKEKQTLVKGIIRDVEADKSKITINFF